MPVTNSEPYQIQPQFMWSIFWLYFELAVSHAKKTVRLNGIAIVQDIIIYNNDNNIVFLLFSNKMLYIFTNDEKLKYELKYNKTVKLPI